MLLVQEQGMQRDITDSVSSLSYRTFGAEEREEIEVSQTVPCDE